MKRLGLVIGTAFGVGMAPIPAMAGAGGLTGSYEGKLACTGLDGGTPHRTREHLEGASAVGISDLGAGRVAIRVPGLPDFEAFVQPVLGIPASGFSGLGGITCSLDADLSGATLLGTSKEKNGKAAIRALIIRLDEAGGETRTCRLSLKRVDTADPGVTGDGGCS